MSAIQDFVILTKVALVVVVVLVDGKKKWPKSKEGGGMIPEAKCLTVSQPSCKIRVGVPTFSERYTAPGSTKSL